MAWIEVGFYLRCKDVIMENIGIQKSVDKVGWSWFCVVFHIRISCLGLGLEDDVRDRGSNKNNMKTKA